MNIESLRLVSIKNLSNGSQKLWYQGEGIYFDLFIIILKDKIMWIQLSVDGSFLDLNLITKKIIFGFTDEFSLENSLSPKSKILFEDISQKEKMLKLLCEISIFYKEKQEFKYILEFLKKESLCKS